jgi:hypothetical protein
MNRAEMKSIRALCVAGMLLVAGCADLEETANAVQLDDDNASALAAANGVTFADPPGGCDYASGDVDCDGVPDALEKALARKFFPNITNSRGFDWWQFYGNLKCDDCRVPYSVDFYKNTSGRAPGYCTEDYQCLALRIGLAYEKDDGKDGLYSHNGDSEYVSFLLQRSAAGKTGGSPWSTAKFDENAWGIVSVAYEHHGDRLYSSGLAKRGDIGPRNPIWMYSSESKHASYMTRYECDRQCLPDPFVCLAHDNCWEWACTAPNFRHLGTLDRLLNIGRPGTPVDGSTFRFPVANIDFCPSDQPPYEVWSPGSYFGGASDYDSKFRRYDDWATFIDCCTTNRCAFYFGSNGACNEPWGEVQPDNPAECAPQALLANGEALLPGQYRLSTDGRFKFIYQTDGNLVLYQGTTAIWNNGKAGTAAGKTILQTDGNLVTYDAYGVARWSSRTAGVGTVAYVYVQPDGNVVMYDSMHNARWATNTCCR